MNHDGTSNRTRAIGARNAAARRVRRVTLVTGISALALTGWVANAAYQSRPASTTSPAVAQASASPSAATVKRRSQVAATVRTTRAVSASRRTPAVVVTPRVVVPPTPTPVQPVAVSGGS